LVQDAAPTLIITDTRHLHLARELALPACGVVTFDPALMEGPSHDLSLPIGHDHTSILVYTSGSTGRPKGVMQTHGQRLRNAGHTKAMGYDANDRIPLLGSHSAGQAYGTIFCALFNGAQLFPYPLRVRGTTGLAAWLIDNGITTLRRQPLFSASSQGHYRRGLLSRLSGPFASPLRRPPRTITACFNGNFLSNAASSTLCLPARLPSSPCIPNQQRRMFRTVGSQSAISQRELSCDCSTSMIGRLNRVTLAKLSSEAVSLRQATGGNPRSPKTILGRARGNTTIQNRRSGEV
jgi:hypothetical protein